MKHLLAAFAVLVGVAVTAKGHFVWIVPEEQSARIVFGNTPEPDDAALLKKITQTEVFIRHAEKEKRLDDFRYSIDVQGKNAFQITLSGSGPRLIGGVCAYGVVEKGDAPFMLNYYAAALVRADANRELAHKLATTSWSRLPLEIVPAAGKSQFQVLWQGKPLADAEVFFSAPGEENQEKTTTDKAGFFDIGSFQDGLCGIRTRHVEKKRGDHDGKKYEEVRHYTTLTVQIGEEKKAAAGVKADPLATKMLADARAARAEWHKFPGFSADVVVNIEGKLSRGKVTVEPGGKVVFEKLDAEAEAWAKRQLASIVAHRIGDASTLETPCAFADNDVDNPLGRAITVLNDELHSSYRIRDRQIIVVNRNMKGMKFSITVLENSTNKEGKFLPASYVVHYWDTKSGDLSRTESHWQSWTRVGGFDLPVTALVITAGRELSTRTLTLSNHQLTR